MDCLAKILQRATFFAKSASLHPSVCLYQSLALSYARTLEHAHTHSSYPDTHSLSLIKVFVHLMTENAKVLHTLVTEEEEFLKHKFCNCLC